MNGILRRCSQNVMKYSLLYRGQTQVCSLNFRQNSSQPQASNSVEESRKSSENDKPISYLKSDAFKYKASRTFRGLYLFF